MFGRAGTSRGATEVVFEALLVFAILVIMWLLISEASRRTSDIVGGGTGARGSALEVESALAKTVQACWDANRNTRAWVQCAEFPVNVTDSGNVSAARVSSMLSCAPDCALVWHAEGMPNNARVAFNGYNSTIEVWLVK